MTGFKNRLCHILVATLLLALAGCTPRFTEREEQGNDRSHQPAEHPSRYTSPRASTGKILLTIEGVASYYADDFHGKKTSNGETYDMNALTAAHRTFPFGTKVRVTNLENNKSVVVRVNDRGPFKEGRIVDLSLGAAKAIDLIRTGTARVRLDVLDWGNGQ
jgi:rare lipoprotein A